LNGSRPFPFPRCPRGLVIAMVLSLFHLVACHKSDKLSPPNPFTYSPGPVVLTVGKALTPLTPVGGSSGPSFYYRLEPGKTLPLGLVMDSANGTISGAPIASSPATSYTVVAYRYVDPDNTFATLQTASALTIAINRPGFTPTGSMATARQDHTATVLPDGRVLVAGGSCNGSVLATAEIYDPATGSFTPTGPMLSPRTHHTAQVAGWNPSVVLFLGGDDGTRILSTIEAYDLTTGTFKPIGAMTEPRRFHTSTMLNLPAPSFGTAILVAGGEGPGGWLASAELIDPDTFVATATSPMATPRGRHAASAPGNHICYVVGGFNGAYLASVEYFDLADRKFHSSGPLNLPLADCTMGIEGGSQVVAGGRNDEGATANAGIYTFDAAVAPLPFFSPGPPMLFPRYGHRRSYLQFEGYTLITGGFDGTGHALATAERRQASDGAVTSLGAMTTARARHTATYLNNGLLLIAGGVGADGKSLASAEVF